MSVAVALGSEQPRGSVLPWPRTVEATVHTARTPVLVFLAKTGFTLAQFGQAMRTVYTLVQAGSPVRVTRTNPSDLLALMGGIRDAHATLVRTHARRGVRGQRPPTWEQFYSSVMEPVLRRKSLVEPFSWERVGRDDWKVTEAYDSEQELGALFRMASAQPANQGSDNERSGDGSESCVWAMRPAHPLLRTRLNDPPWLCSKVTREGSITQKVGTAEYLIRVVASTKVRASEFASLPSHGLFVVDELKETLWQLIDPARPPVGVSPTKRLRKIEGSQLFSETVDMLVTLG